MVEQVSTVDAPTATAVPSPELHLDHCRGCQGCSPCRCLRRSSPDISSTSVPRTIWRMPRGLSSGPRRKLLATLEAVVGDTLVIVSQPPTRRRLSILAFQPILIDGNAVRLSPLVISALGVGETSDRVIVRAPLSPSAQREARTLMLPSRNLLDPASGMLACEPPADMVLGCFYLTTERYQRRGEGRKFGKLGGRHPSLRPSHDTRGGRDRSPGADFRTDVPRTGRQPPGVRHGSIGSIRTIPPRSSGNSWKWSRRRSARSSSPRRSTSPAPLC